MSDNALFAQKKQETIDRLLGKDASYPIPETVTTKDVDANWNRNKAWYDNVRIVPNMNSRNTIDTIKYEFATRDNGGVLVTQATETLAEEAPVIK